MKIKDACLDIIIIMSISDNKLYDKEKKTIINFAKNNFKEDIDINHKINLYIGLTQKELKNAFISAVFDLKEKTTKNFKFKIIDFIVNLSLIDNELSLQEKKFFDIMISNWGIDIQEYFSKKNE